nr:MAG TPA: hypothetical protein [Caudoviricetes sp.]
MLPEALPHKFGTREHVGTPNSYLSIYEIYFLIL